MKKLILAAITLLGISAAAVAQTTNQSKTKDAKMQLTKTAASKKQTQSSAAVATQKPVVTATVKKEEKKQPITTSTVAAKNTNTAVKKTSSSTNMQTKANSNMAGHTALQHAKKDGTPDKRYKENKKHS